MKTSIHLLLITIFFAFQALLLAQNEKETGKFVEEKAGKQKKW